MFFTERKLEARIEEIEKFRYREKYSLECLLSKEDVDGEVGAKIPTEFNGWSKIKVGERWKGRDLYLWLHKCVEVPESWRGRKVVGLFDYGNTGGGNNSGFEALLYINGEPYQGVDANHKEVFFTEDLLKAEMELTFRLWSGLEGGGKPAVQEHLIREAAIAWLDEKVDHLYYLSQTILKTIHILEEFNPIKTNLTTLLNRTYRLIDWEVPGSESFYLSLYEAGDYLEQELERIDKQAAINVKCIGHTHIDVAWLWRLKHTREKCARSFSTAIRLMEEYPEYIFLQTQPQLYEYIKNDYPQIYERIQDKVRSGQWEVDGGMWVEADCNLTSGESLTRQILIGSKFIKEEFGKEVEYLWLPDVFGYSWALPQILKKSGISMLMTTKISWNQYNRMPHDTFKWRGIDGSEIITHFITTPEPWSKPGSWFYTYNGQLQPQTVKGVWDAYSEKGLTDELLVSYGYGDGGGGVNREMLEYRRCMDKVPGLPSVQTSKAGEYFGRLKDKIEDTDQYVHVWDGELYLEYHRGTYTSQAYNKKMNRKLEILYREAEWLSVVKGMQAKDLETIEQKQLTEGWKIILRNQFHDIIPGSSIHEVYEDSRKEYDEALAIAKDVEENSLNTWITQKENAYIVINASNWARSELVEIQKEEDGIWLDQEGKELKAQKNGDKWCIKIEDVPPMGFTSITFKAGEYQEISSPIIIEDELIETPFYKIKFNRKGQIISLWDKENEIEVLAEGEQANVFQIFEDKPLAHDAWDIELYYQEKMKKVEELKRVEILENNHLRAIVHFEWQYGKTTIKQDMIIYTYDRRIDFKTWVEWKERRKLLKVAFPVDIRATYATYDIQYGNVRRATNWNTSWDWAKFETVAQKWVDLSERGYGVALLNDCKYGHDIKDNIIRLTLLKAGLYPDPEQDQGEHEFTYSLLPHKGDFVEGNVVPKAWELNQPLKVVEGMTTHQEYSFIKIDNEFVELDAVKKSEDGQYIVIRLHEYTGAKQEINLNLGCKIEGWMEADLMERPLEEIKEEQNIYLKIRPFEIKTLLVRLAQG